jgi:toxin ParE1/3/4
LKLRFTPQAAENIGAIADYIRKRNPQAARKVRAAVYEGLRHIIMFPLIGRQQKEQGVRKLITPRYAYLIYYMLDEIADEIIILAIKHSAQERTFRDL